MGVFKSVGKAMGGPVVETVRLIDGASVRHPDSTGAYSSAACIAFSSDTQLMDQTRSMSIAGDTLRGLEAILSGAQEGGTDKQPQSPPVSVISFAPTTFQNGQCDTGPSGTGGTGAVAAVAFCQPEDVQSGLLSKITVCYDSGGVRGIQQYFGNIPGTYMGSVGNLLEATFSIPYNDPIVSVVAIYKTVNSQPNLMAVRLVTIGGQDSGWLGADLPSDSNSYYEVRYRHRVEHQGGWVLHPIYAIDAFVYQKSMVVPGSPNTFPANNIMSLTMRHCPPFDVTVDMEEAVPVQDLPDTKNSFDLQWDYDNSKLDQEQTIYISDRITSVSSHTVTNSESESVSSSFSVSLSGSILSDGGYMSGSANRNSSTSMVATQTDSVSLTQSEERDIEFPLKIPANTHIKATLLSRSTQHCANGTVTITYGVKGDGDKPRDLPTIQFPIELSGVACIQNLITVEKVT